MPSDKKVLSATRPTRSSTPTMPPPSHATTIFSRPRGDGLFSLPSTYPDGDDTALHVNFDSSQMPRYRPAAHLPEHIREHCTIYLDEQLYTSAITLLSDLVTNGNAHKDRETRRVYAPPPFHIELVACLLVHPRYTNQAPPNEHTHLTSQAITFLRNTLVILGPVNANLKDAFSMTYDESRAARRRAHNDGNYDNSSSDSDERSEHMKGIIANKGRLRRCAKDFWHAVGWAFNCSVKYPARWKYWKVWLEYMIDVLEADFFERERLDKEAAEDPNVQIKQEMDPGHVSEKNIQNCLLLQYLTVVQGRRSPLLRVVRSVFAGASTKSLEEFPEVFSGETRAVKHTGQKRKRGNDFGDYNDEDDEPEESAETTDQVSDAFDADSGRCSDDDPYMGGPEAMVVRQRLIKLLSRAAHYYSTEFVTTHELYDQIYICMKDLPVAAFSLFVAPPFASCIPVEAYISITMLYLLRLLPGNAPQPHQVQQKLGDELSSIVLEKCYLPFAANTSTVSDNARVSIQIESLLRLFLKACDWEYSAKFEAALEKGILARENKIKTRRSKDAGRKEDTEDADLLWLKGSGERLRMLAKFMKQR